MRRVISIDNWGAALIAALGLSACGGNVKKTTGSGKNPSLDFSCKDATPLPIAGQKDTGFDVCSQGYVHRRQPVQCPDLLPTTACGGADAGGCSSDSDCTGPRYGYCANTNGVCNCSVGCRTDADCGPGRLCYCGDPIGRCVTASCRTDADCASGYHCASYESGTCTPSISGFACQADGDNCAGDADCKSNELCGYNGAHRVCLPFDPTQCMMGRPFLVEGSARLAGIIERDDWADALTPRLDGLGEAERAELAQRWTQIGLMEHASVAAFARFALQLLSLGAPAELLERTHAAMADETRHARLGFALASAYAGQSVGPGALPVDGALDDNSPRGIIATLVREGCIGETIAALEAAEAREHATDPRVRAVLEQITADETRHAELAWRTLSWALESGDAQLGRAVREELWAALDEPAPSVERTAALDEDALLAHGLVAGRLRAELRRDALERAVRPCAHALLAQAPQRRGRDEQRSASFA